MSMLSVLVATIPLVSGLQDVSINSTGCSSLFPKLDNSFVFVNHSSSIFLDVQSEVYSYFYIETDPQLPLKVVLISSSELYLVTSDASLNRSPTIEDHEGIAYPLVPLVAEIDGPRINAGSTIELPPGQACIAVGVYPKYNEKATINVLYLPELYPDLPGGEALTQTQGPEPNLKNELVGMTLIACAMFWMLIYGLACVRKIVQSLIDLKLGFRSKNKRSELVSILDAEAKRQFKYHSLENDD